MDGKTEAGRIAFLLSQVGAHVASQYVERIGALGLKPTEARVLREIAAADGLSQQALGERLAVYPSRLVGLIDALEKLGLVERRDRPGDRRSYALCLTDAGWKRLEGIEHSVNEQANELCRDLDPSQRVILNELLDRIARGAGLSPGIHPEFRKSVDGS